MSVTGGTHLFGSRVGYTTLAKSPDVTDNEEQELSVLGFGQTNDPIFLSNLSSIPSAFGRRLTSGRFAITRCFKGDADDAGRPTLRLCSILLSANHYREVARSGLSQLLDDSSVWEQNNFAVGRPVNISLAHQAKSRSVTRSDLAVLDAWLSAIADSSSLSVLPDNVSTSNAILELPQVLADMDCVHFRWGLRLLGTSVPVDVCTLSTGASRSGRRRAVVFGADNSWRNPAVAHLASCLTNGIEKLPPVRNLIPEATSQIAATLQSNERMYPAKRFSIFKKHRVMAASIAIVVLGTIAIWAYLFARRMTAAPNNADTYATETQVVIAPNNNEQPQVAMQIGQSDVSAPYVPIKPRITTADSDVPAKTEAGSGIPSEPTPDVVDSHPSTAPEEASPKESDSKSNTTSSSARSGGAQVEPTSTVAPPPIEHQMPPQIDSGLQAHKASESPTDRIRAGLFSIGADPRKAAPKLKEFLSDIQQVRARVDELTKEREDWFGKTNNSKYPFEGQHEIDVQTDALTHAFASLICTVRGLVESCLKEIDAGNLTSDGDIIQCTEYVEALGQGVQAIKLIQSQKNEKFVNDAIAVQEKKIEDEYQRELDRINDSPLEEQSNRDRRKASARRDEEKRNLRPDWLALRSKAERWKSNLERRRKELQDIQDSQGSKSGIGPNPGGGVKNDGDPNH